MLPAIILAAVLAAAFALAVALTAAYLDGQLKSIIAHKGEGR